MSSADASASPRYQAPYKATVREAANRGGSIMGRLVATTRQALQMLVAAFKDLDTKARKVLHLRLVQLAGTGFHLHLDDFEIGQSSLHRIQLLALGSLRLDKSFADLLLEGVEMIPRLMLSLAKDLNIRVIAKGVETRQQVAPL
jgi:sensor c-di-GMP phosphodiesterase-like protein